MEKKITISQTLRQPLKIEVEFYTFSEDWIELALEEAEKIHEILYSDSQPIITAQDIQELEKSEKLSGGFPSVANFSRKETFVF